MFTTQHSHFEKCFVKMKFSSIDDSYNNYHYCHLAVYSLKGQYYSTANMIKFIINIYCVEKIKKCYGF